VQIEDESIAPTSPIDNVANTRLRNYTPTSD